jgi:hypothetical protein
MIMGIVIHSILKEFGLSRTSVTHSKNVTFSETSPDIVIGFYDFMSPSMIGFGVLDS